MHCVNAASIRRYLTRGAWVTLFALCLMPSRLIADGPVGDLPLGLPAFPQAGDDPALVAYGAFLFQSNLLSSDRSVACASCHVPALGFSGARPTVVGVGGRQGHRHA